MIDSTTKTVLSTDAVGVSCLFVFTVSPGLSVSRELVVGIVYLFSHGLFSAHLNIDVSVCLFLPWELPLQFCKKTKHDCDQKCFRDLKLC